MAVLSASTLLLLLQDAVRVGTLVALLLLARGVLWLAHMMVIAPPFDPLRKLPGPDAPALQNHFREVMDPNISPDTHHDWVGRYGKMFRFHGFGRHDYRLMAFDFRALSHILNSPIYEKPWQTRTFIARLLGRGVFSMEGEEHKIQRRVIAPAFSTSSVKAMAPIFFQKAEELRDRWLALIHTSSTSPTAVQQQQPIPSTNKAGQSVIDISHWVARATFDVIGLAGFDYHFHALQDESEDVYLAYRKMFNVQDKGPGLKAIVSLFFPIINTLFPDDGLRTTKESLRTINEAGKRLVANKKAAILAEKASAQDIDDKDILSLLIKQNLSEESSKRLSDVELLDQLSTFLFAGSDSTALSISWCLHLLSLNPEMQTRLREEIASLSIASPTGASPTGGALKADCIPDSGFAETFSPLPAPPTHPSSTIPSDSSAAHCDAIDALPFLDAVVRETLRLCPPVHGIIRVATQDDLIPVSSTVHMRDGRVLSQDEHIKIKKGSYIHVPIEGLNFSEDVWGKDARAFNPERWTALPASARHPGLAGVMTFSFGPHSCPGWKFTILEMKIFIASILPHFVFSPAEGVEIRKFNAILTRPYVKDHWDEGTKLPITVTPYCG
ncbi:hypothetical protein PC9H_004119 [Pleurotus ostreatus]|uniref:Cytochrome P450 n=1 Tax=Pleurotus ostreatus TaxID=5322 RepID=A0A8H7A3Q8_PLEOS|nr:uncharacterized protein PC9H_004119 [Pleurotus ostreatus]KAF7437281.1 hypothetical protein PC9H_004119 [Pleurotus ostreatus]KAJ8703171.1 hypothetical protein PTI98_001819 [Pleurotus ostreatus]